MKRQLIGHTLGGIPLYQCEASWTNGVVEELDGIDHVAWQTRRTGLVWVELSMFQAYMDEMLALSQKFDDWYCKTPKEGE